MAELTFDTLNCEGSKYITVDNVTITPTAGDTVTLINHLVGNIDANFEVFEVGTKDGGTAISGFCDGEGATVQIPGIGVNPSKDCVVADTMDGVYQYRVHADNHKDLDPVIIVEPQFANLWSFVSAPVVAGIGAVAVIAASVIAYRAGRRAGARAAAS